MSAIIAPSPVPSPALLSRPVAGRGLRSFDIASELGDTAVAWCIRDLATGEQQRFLHPRERGQEVLDSLTQNVAQWAAERAGDQQVSLRCFSIALRDAVTDKLDAHRFVPADLISMNTSADWAQQTRAHLRDELARHEQAQFAKRVIYGASDGSVHPIYGNGAYAWVSSDGRWHVARSHTRILASEVMGILSFVRAFIAEGSHHRAVLFVDSLNAIEAVTEGPFVHSRINQATLELARTLIKTGRLELIWVRGHQGHVLNDIADRIALQRHRAVRSQLTETQLHAICQKIVAGAAGTFAQTDWWEVARTAREAHRAHLRQHKRAA